MSTTFSTRARRGLAVVAAAGAASIALSGCNPASSDPEEAASLAREQLRIIVPAAAGGSMDAMARQVQPYLAETLDATVVVENMPSGGAMIGTQHVLDNGGDCLTILTSNTPHLNLSYLTNDVEFSLEDFAPLAGVTIEPGLIRVAGDAPWDTLQELVDDALERPGEITFSVSDLASSNYIGLVQIMDATGAEFKVLGYDGGGPARTALLSGEVDATHAGVFNTLSVADETKALAVQEDENRWTAQTKDAPTVDEALGADVPSQSSHPSLLASAECAETNPDRYELIVDALADAIQSPDYLADLAELGEEGRDDYLSPDELLALLQRTDEEIIALLEENPDFFTGGQ